MKRICITLLLLFSMLLSACGSTGSSSTPDAPVEEKAYVYPGETRRMAYKNPAYEKDSYAEGASYSPVFTNEELKQQFSYTGTIHWVDCCENHVFTVLSLPEGYDGTQTYPLVLMLHGFNSTLDEWTYYVKPLNDAGYACLLFDFRGGHSGNASRSDGKMNQMSFDTKLADIRAVLAYAETLDMVDPDKLLLAGHSQGGMMALISMCDEALSKRFNGTLLLAPYTDAALVASYEAPEDVPESESLLLCTVGKDYLYAAWKYEHSIWNTLPSYDRPTLILTGGADSIVKEESVQRIAEIIGENATYALIPEGYHDFQPELIDGVINDYILPFFGGLI